VTKKTYAKDCLVFGSGVIASNSNNIGEIKESLKQLISDVG